MSAKTLVNWEWLDDDGMWTPYHHEDNLLLESAFAKGSDAEFKTTALSFNKEYLSTYCYDFKKLLQKNLDSGRVRKLRRIESSADADEVGFVSALGVAALMASTTIVPPSPSSPLKPTAVTPDEEPPTKKAKFEFPGLALSSTPATSPPPSATAVAPATSAPGVAVAITPALTATAPASTASVVAAVMAVDPLVVAAQVALGAQSLRKQKYDLGPVAKDPHGKHCFDTMLHREKQLCGEFVVFYHSYSFAALLYEVQAAVAAVLFRFKSEYASLPRLLLAPYKDLPDAQALLAAFPKMPTRDHDPKFRAVAICGTSSALAPDSEAPPKAVFLSGYSCSDLSFVGVLESLLVSCGVPPAAKANLAQKIIHLCSVHGLDATQFKGKPCASGRPGHMLQIFVKRSIVDRYVYPAFPFGVFDKSRKDLGKYLEGPGPMQGQVRIVTHPSVFMRGHAVRMYVYSADSTFHANRQKFQKDLSDILGPIIGASSTRVAAAKGIYGGFLPSWFNPDDYETEAKKKAAAAAATSGSGGGT